MPAGVRYIVNDVDAAVAFYTQKLAFQAEMHVPNAFAMLTRGDLRLALNRPGGGGGGGMSMPDGQVPAPGGWNRIMIETDDIETMVASLRGDGATFRNDIVVGNGGKQILLEDPSGNAIELFQPAQR